MTKLEALAIIRDNPVYVSGDDDLSDPVAVANMVLDRKADDAVELETGHVIRRKGSDSKRGQGCVRHTNVSSHPDELEGNEVRIQWSDLGMRDTIEHPGNLEVRVRAGRRLVWVDAK